MPSDRMLEYYYAMGQDAIALENYDDAVIYFRKAANMGAGEAVSEICQLGYRFERGEGMEKDLVRARECYEVSAEYGDSDGALHAGKLYLSGVGKEKPNGRKAKKLLEKASDAGSGEAAGLLAKIYDEGTLGRVNAKKAFQYYLLAAERGEPQAMLMTGLFYAQGVSTSKDLDAAEMWIRKGASAGDTDGRETLRTFLSVAATEYATGRAGSLDDERAHAMAEEAEKLGNKEAFLLLGEVYRSRDKRNGHGERAFRCFLRAEKQNLPQARAALGFCYEAGLGVEADIKKAVSYYKKAAAEDVPFAMARLGYAYEMGEGIRKNEKLAIEWLIKAALRGDKGAIHTLKEDYEYEVK